MLWLRLALIGVIVVAIAGAVAKFTSFLNEKDIQIQPYDIISVPKAVRR